MDLKELMEAVARLTGRVEALQKQNSESYIKRDELDKTIDAYIKAAHPKKPAGLMLPEAATMEDMEAHVLRRFADFKNRPDAYSVPQPYTSEYGKKFGNMRGFLNAVLRKDMSRLRWEFMDPEGSKAASDGMTEGTGASGGFTVPTEFSYEVLRLLTADTILRQISRIFPMSTWKRTLPRQLTGVTVAWVDEFGTKGITNPTFGQLTQEAKVLAAVVKLSDELLRDTAINHNLFLAELVSEASGIEEERVGLVGNTAAGDPFMGVYYAVGVNTATMAGANLAYDDLINQQFTLSAANDKNSDWVVNRTSLKIIMKLKAPGSGEYLWSRPREGIPGSILERPYHMSDQMPTNLGVGGNETPILYGNFKRGLWVSDREGMVVKASQDASDWVAGALDSAFMTDQTWLRFTRAMSIDVAVPAGFVRQLVK